MVMDMDMDMATMDTMARGLLRPSLDMVIMVMDMVVMDIMDIMARGLLMLSPAMDIMVMDTVMDMVMAMDMDMDMATMDTMARDQLMLSQDMDIMAMDMDITVRQEPECCYFLEFSTTEVDQNRSSQDKHTFQLTEINIYKK